MADPGGEPAPSRGGAFTYRGRVRFEYAPEIDSDPDPGEIVWSWVAFEEDAEIGKDRPIAIIGRTDDARFAALMLSSRDHAGDRRWVSIGTGAWDRQGRVSWLRTDRVLAVHAESVRREGAIMSREVFDRVVVAVGGTLPAARPRRLGFLRNLFRRAGT